MLFYDKRVVYLSYLEDNVKIKSAGYIRIEIRDKLFSMDMHVSVKGMTESGKYEIAAESGGETIPVGMIYLQNGEGSFHGEFPAEEIGRSGYRVAYDDIGRFKVALSEGVCIAGNLPFEGKEKRAEKKISPKVQAEWQFQASEKQSQIQPAEQPSAQSKKQSQKQPEEQLRTQSQEQSQIQPEKQPEMQPLTQAKEQSQKQPEGHSQTKPEMQSRKQSEKQIQPGSEKQLQTWSEIEPQTGSEIYAKRQLEVQASQEKVHTFVQAHDEDVRKKLEEMRLTPDKWQHLLKSYRQIHPYGDDRLYISIEPKDFLTVVNEEYQHLAHNSFLLHGFYNYRHIILGAEGEMFYLGVPGVFYEREKMVAMMFGFEAFECEGGRAENGKFGYYLKKIKI